MKKEWTSIWTETAGIPGSLLRLFTPYRKQNEIIGIFSNDITTIKNRQTLKEKTKIILALELRDFDFSFAPNN